ncbi:F0F1 ATP synthase subunit A [Balneola sp. MJW-20]|uniref:F0F1 ATP synthase subunit A n=1 Tax=Gracilimonas aurantiaca TaxID=3234185 RepID=UPI003466518B
MELNIDDIIFWESGFFKVNATLLNSWVLIFSLCIGAIIINRKLQAGINIGRAQAMMEAFIVYVLEQIELETNIRPTRYLPFIATLFLYIVSANLLSVIPIFYSPTASLSTASALALCVFMAVPIFGITQTGFKNYMRKYIRPTPLMLPFNIIGELSRTLALAIRLFGNVMSGSLIIAILLSISPLFFPVIMQAFGILVGVIQAYVFSVLALVYIISAVSVQSDNVELQEVNHNQNPEDNNG